MKDRDARLQKKGDRMPTGPRTRYPMLQCANCKNRWIDGREEWFGVNARTVIKRPAPCPKCGSLRHNVVGEYQEER